MVLEHNNRGFNYLSVYFEYIINALHQRSLGNVGTTTVVLRPKLAREEAEQEFRVGEHGGDQLSFRSSKGNGRRGE